MHVIHVWHQIRERSGALASEEKRIALLVKEGPKHDHYIVFDSSGLHVSRCPADDDSFYDILDYPVKKAAIRLLAFGQQVGMTQEARALLEAA